MNELAACQVLEFLWGRLTPQSLATMRMTTEAQDHVAMSTGLSHGKLKPPAKLLWHLLDEFLSELNRSIQVAEIFGVPER